MNATYRIVGDNFTQVETNLDAFDNSYVLSWYVRKCPTKVLPKSLKCPLVVRGLTAYDIGCDNSADDYFNQRQMSLDGIGCLFFNIEFDIPDSSGWIWAKINISMCYDGIVGGQQRRCLLESAVHSTATEQKQRHNKTVSDWKRLKKTDKDLNETGLTCYYTSCSIWLFA